MQSSLPVNRDRAGNLVQPPFFLVGDAQPQNYKRSGSQQKRTLINALNSFNEICGLLTHFPDFASRGQACGTISMNPPVLWLPC